MDKIPTFNGLKYTATDAFVFQQIKAISAKKGKDLNMISGPDEMNVAFAVMGSDGAIGSTYNLMPKMFVRLRNAFENGDMALAMETQTNANEVIAILIDDCGCRELGTNILNGINCVLRARGFDVGNPAPLMLSKQMSDAECSALVTKLDELPFVVE